MSCIHFKFKNRQDYEKVPISGLEISGRELKEAIMEKKKISHSNLEIKDAQTKRVYSDTDMIKRNASVVVERSVIQNAARLPKTQHKDPSLLPPAGQDPLIFTVNEPQKPSDLTTYPGTEQDKLEKMIDQAGEGYRPEDYAKLPMRPGIHPAIHQRPPPRGYVCNRCRKPGHWIQLCPTNGDPNFDKRNKHDLPKTSTVGVKAKYVAPAPKEKAIPEELKCPICKKLLRDAVVIPCCQKSFCDECIREHLLSQEEFTCPLCEEADVSPDSLGPNKELRGLVKQFKSQAEEEKSIAVANLFSDATLTPHQVSASHISPKPPVTSSTSSLLSQLTSQLKPPVTSSTSSLLSQLTSQSKPPVTSSTSSLLSQLTPQSKAPLPTASTSVAATNNTTTTSAIISNSPKKPVPEVVAPVVMESVKKTDSQGGGETPSKTVEPTAAPPDTEKDSSSVEKTETSQPESSTKLNVTDVKTESRSPSPQPATRSKSPVLSDPKKPSHQSSVISHPLATAATHPKLRLPTLHPPLPLVTRLPPPIISLPLLPGQSAPIAGNPGLLNSVPGLGVIRTSQPVVRPPVVKDYQAEAEFLLSQKRSRPASPPLTADEFYRQQKILNQFILRKSPVHSMDARSDHSHSSGSESDDMSDSHSSSASVSESDMSTYSHSPSHSRSPSPQKRKSSRYTSSRKTDAAHPRKKKRAKESTKDKDRGRERERERGRGRHRRKRKRHEVSEESKHKSKRHRQRVTRSRDGSIDYHYHQSSDNISSTASETMWHQHRHKKTGKRKHRHHRSSRRREEAPDGGRRDRPLATAEELESKILDGSNEAGIVDDSVSLETGEVPSVDSDNALNATEATETVEQALPNDGTVGSEASSLMTAREEVGKIENMETQLAVTPADEQSEDRLLNDIDQLLAEEEATEQMSEKCLKPNNSVGPTCVDVDTQVVGEREMEGNEMCEDTATTSKDAAAGGRGDEADQLCLHAEETIDEDDADLEFDRSLSDATDGLEEGELLSDADMQGGGQLAGQEVLDPILGTSVPKRPRVKSRLRSVASTVQVVNSSATPPLTPTDVESVVSSPLPPPVSPPPPPVRQERSKAHKQHRDGETDHKHRHKPKKKRAKEKEVATEHGHRHVRKKMDREERGRVRKKVHTHSKRHAKHRHHHKKHRHSSPN